MMEKKRAELLSPCGNFECVKAALNSGADAVYLGGQLFNARAFAANFGLGELEEVCDLCHSFGVKVYVTVNTLYKDAEFGELLPFVDALSAMGADGLIMQDLGAIALVRKHWQDLPVHASTQLTANSLGDVLELKAMGLTTAVLSRELNLKEIREIAEKSGMRIETFIHGALCVSYSGQCLMSSVLGSRSGNRGKCAQNCRLPYALLCDERTAAQGHLLSTKDICTLALLPELLETGVASLKIEGRMKTPEYVAGVTGIYRKYLDLYYSGEPYAVDPQDVLTLQQLFNRGAFSEGYLKTHSGSSMMCPAHPRAWGVPAGKVAGYDRQKGMASLRFEMDMVPGDGIEVWTDTDEGTGSYLNRSCRAGETVPVRIDGPVKKNQPVYRTFDKRLMDRLKREYASVDRKAVLDGEVCLRAGQPAALRVSSGGVTVTVSGEVPEEAKNQALTAETVLGQIGKLGGTYYRPGQLSAEVEDGLYLNKSALNALRGRAVEELRAAVCASYKRPAAAPVPDELQNVPLSGMRSLSVRVRTRGQFDAALACESVSVIYAEMNGALTDQAETLADAAHGAGKQLFVKVPRIWRDYVQKNEAARLERWRSSAADGFLISCLGHYHAVKDSGMRFALDHTGNVLNSRTYAFWKELGAVRIAVSPEMSREEINELADRSLTEVLAYGYLPLMVTHQCPVGNFAGGKLDRMYCRARNHKEAYLLRSEKGSFPLETDCENCVCTVLSPEPLDIRQGMSGFDAETFRMDLTTESPAEVRTLLDAYAKALNRPAPGSGEHFGVYSKSVL